MELKDVILSTLAEIDESPEKETPAVAVAKPLPEPEEVNIDFSAEAAAILETAKNEEKFSGSHDEEIRMLEGIRERLLVLFEGFQSPNNAQIEAKVDLTLNFLEYLLATIESRLDTIK